ncbi:MAG: cupin domain-containing protein [Hormoscilla sp. GUM202]|nr:cupin domain-containing protein [Hormoscilla sp. GUM202]
MFWRQNRSSRRQILPLGAIALLLAVSCGRGDRHQSSMVAEKSTAPVTREVLAQGKPGGEPCRVLELVRYTIAAGVKLPPHTHPGMQIGTVKSGVLTYQVVEGESKITRGKDGSVETLHTGAQTKLYAGDSLVEPEAMVHFGQNDGSEPVVLLSSSLFACDRPPSQILE